MNISTQSAKQFWPRPLPDGVLMDGQNEGRQGQPSVHPSVHPSSTGRARAKALTPSEARLVAWLEVYAVGAIAPERRPAAVRDRAGRGGFVGGRRFVLKYGAALILEAVGEMTCFLTLSDALGELRYWRPAIVSPAQYLNWMVQELAGTAEVEDRVERRLRAVDERAGRA